MNTIINKMTINQSIVESVTNWLRPLLAPPPLTLIGRQILGTVLTLKPVVVGPGGAVAMTTVKNVLERVGTKS